MEMKRKEMDDEEGWVSTSTAIVREHRGVKAGHPVGFISMEWISSSLHATKKCGGEQFFFFGF